MKDTTASTSASASREREEHGDREEIARLLPAPPDRDLPREQHLRHKELLMRHIDRDQAQAQAQAQGQAKTRTRTRTRTQAHSSGAARRLLRPALLAPATALVLAGALTAGVALSGDRQEGAGTSAGGSGPDRTSTGADMRPAAALLHRISDAAGRQEAPTVRDDQFVYTREKGREADLTSGKLVVGPMKDRESWLAQKPGPLHKLGMARVDGETTAINAELGDTNGTPAGLGRPTYRWLSSLPTDPDELLSYLYEKTPHAKGRERDQAVFEEIGSLLGGLMPPRTAAAFYRAAARIPGVAKAPRAHDALGRKGLGIARNDDRHGVRTEWVFDEKDFSFLGSRSYLTKDSPQGKSGTLLSSSAELEAAVVDKAGRSPARKS